MLTLLYDPRDEETVRERVLALFEGATAVPLDASALPELAAGSTVVTYMSDAALAGLVPEAAARGWRVGLLPHPAMRQARLGLGVSGDLVEAALDVTGSEETARVDLLYCNGEVVLNSVVIGEPFMGTPATASREGLLRRAGRLLRMVRTLRGATPGRFRLVTAKGKELETAALGIVAVEHGRSAVLSRRLIQDSAVNDGMLHALIYAPRSLLAMLWFQLISVFVPRLRVGRPLPSFVGHIKTESLAITSPRAVGLSVDGRSGSADSVELRVERGALSLIPGRHLQVESVAQESKEIFRVQGIPTGDVLAEMKDRALPWVHHASPEEFRELFQVLRENARISESYLILMVLSTLLATFGLFANSAPVIIGAMILAPLMSPIVAMGMGVLRKNEQALLRDSVKSFALGVLVAVACTVVVTWLTPLRTVNSEIAARLNPTLLDMGVAVVSGIAGAYAHARSGVARSLAGVAIAVALVPPLAVAGIGIGWGDWSVFSGAALLFLTNFAGMVLAAAGTFLVLGYSPFTYSARGLAFSVLTFAAVTLLLVPGFARMVDEHRTIRLLDGLETEGVQLRDVTVTPGRPLRVSARLLTSEPVTMERIEAVKAALEGVLGREIELEAGIAIVR